MPSFKLQAAAVALAACQAARPIQINVFYETNCPWSQKYVVEKIGPFLQDECVAHMVDFHFVPFGMGTLMEDGKTIQCQHGADECIGNRVQICAKDKLGETEEYSKFVVCMETNLESNGATAGDKSFHQNCLDDHAKLDEIFACAVVDSSLDEADQAGTETQQQTGLTQVPWVTFSTIPTYNLASEDLSQAVCSQLTETNQAPACCAAAAPVARRLGSDATLI